MCGRFVASTPADVVARLFEVDDVRLPDERASYNVAPTDEVRTVVQRGSGRSLEARRWGLVPHWESSADGAAKRINARAETVAERSSFRDAFAAKRCIVPADGFYEWRTLADGTKQPYYIRRLDGRPLAFAGLRATWGPPGAELLRTCAIVTTDANEALSALHDRMPVVLPKHAWDRWLDPAETDTEWLRSLLVPAPEDLLGFVAVSRAVNSVRNDGPELIEPAPERVQDTLPF